MYFKKFHSFESFLIGLLNSFLNINIESNVVESIEAMAKAAGVSVDEIVVIALKRYRSSHAELEGKAPSLD